MNIAYIRVSTKEQHEDRQIKALDRALGKGEYKAFTEKISGKNMDCPELKKMLEYVREGDIYMYQSFPGSADPLPICGL